MTPREGTGDRRQAAEARVGESLTTRWELYAFLGRGAMSTVYAATDSSTGERVAIKVFDPHIARDARIRHAFLADAAAPNAISHPSRTLLIADGMSDRDELFLVTELLAGSSLDHYFRLGGEVASVAEKLRLFDSLLSFLAECHARGIVHRDLKPTNLQLTRSGQLSVLDFGVARLREMEAELEPENEAELTSTSAFMAPEQALGLSDLVDGRADLWSVGACIYTLLTGDEVRKKGAEPLAVTATVPSIAIARPDLPLEVVAFVDKSLSYDRACRFNDAQAMRAELNALRDDVRSGRARPPTRRPELESPSSREGSSRIAPRESGVAWRAGASVATSAPAEDAAPPDSASTSAPVPPRRSSASDIVRPSQRAGRAKVFDPRAEPDLATPELVPTQPEELVSPAEATSGAERLSSNAESSEERAAGGEQRRPSSIVDAIRATANPHEVKTVPPPAPSEPPTAEENAELDSGRMAWHDLPRLGDLARAEKPATLPAPPSMGPSLDDDDIPITMEEDEEPPSPPASDIRELGGSTTTTTATAKVVGRYEIHDRIASGGMASVHIGRLRGPLGFSRTVAIKRMHPHFLGDPEFVSMFLDEARVVAQVRHPNVVPTLDVVVTPGELFLVLEYVQGVTLSSLLRTAAHAGRKMPIPVALAIVSSVLHGLEAAHDARDATGEPLGLVHRDISPQNILVGPDGLARVLDFGVAKARGRLQTTGAGMLKGKLAYMSPEQVRGGEVTRTADVYAAAVVLWESLAGRRLFHGENEASTLERVLWGEVPRPSAHSSDVSQALDAIVMQGLSREPPARFGTALEMASALEELPVAITPVVGRWVREVASAALRTQATRLAEIESQKDDSDEMASVLDTRDGELLRFAP